MSGGLKRTASVKVQKDVIVPQRLLSVSRRGGDEYPSFSNTPNIRGHRRQPSRIHNVLVPSGSHHPQNNDPDQDEDTYGPVQQVLDEYRRRSFLPPSDRRTSWQDAQVLGRPRKTSDPVTNHDRRCVHQPVYVEKTADRGVKAGRARENDTEAFPEFRPQPIPQHRFPLQDRSSDAISSLSSVWGYDESTFSPQNIPRRNNTAQRVVDAVVPDRVQETARNVIGRARRSSMADVYEKAKARGVELQRKRWVEVLFECTIYTVLLCFIYFVLIGMPLWKGAVCWMYWVISTKFVIAGGWSITIAIATFYSFAPLLIFFEREPPVVHHPDDFDRASIQGVATTALLIPCYKSASLIGPTLEAALNVFPASHIFVIANGNSETPLDNTEDICMPYGVNHIWCPVGSKIVAQFVGCYAAKGFKNVLLIDDDCALPPNFPVVSERLTDKVRSIGYTIKSVGPKSSKGTYCQQAQDLEYKISGLQRALAGKMGSATFPHGAISLWNRRFLIETFHDHPGFSVSEDWFFGHSCRRLGGRIKMCTSVFVETETPSAVFFSSGGSRGGFGEMTVFKQRFKRWNFFFVNGMWYNMHYILTSWKLGWWEFGAKLFVFQEVYETLLYLFTPFILPISFLVSPAFCGYLLAGTVVLYLVNVVIFNEVHLRLRNERVGWDVLLIYYMPYKLVLTLVNVASCYWSLYKYARYFAKRHPKVIEDEKAVEVVLRLEETTPVTNGDTIPEDESQGGRRMSVAVLGAQANASMSKRGSTRFSYSGSANDMISVSSPYCLTSPLPTPPSPVSPAPSSRSPYELLSPGCGTSKRLSAHGPYLAVSSAASPYGAPSTSPGSSSSGRQSPAVSKGGGSMQPPQMAHVSGASNVVHFDASLKEKAGPCSIYARRRNSLVPRNVI
ncbi:hypothetical protein DHEL01_v209901 [Diaporthe helianthi]|uniref:Glycosyltransferase family 2 n=1 Tax=Diaporthe helianthi TaxID=158607 RepID=A0A2P5HN98_DIAHE|nr:hypothetical protein DHEL01_v209901 [Diaporthe helianthi]